MTFGFRGSREIVGTSPTVLLQFYPKDVSSIIIKATGALFLGSTGVTITNGFSLGTGDPFGISHIDFSKELINENPEIKIYAVAVVETTAQIMVLGR